MGSFGVVVAILGRVSHEARGLKFFFELFARLPLCRVSHEARGLKLHGAVVWSCICVSRLSRGAWIKMLMMGKKASAASVASLTRRVD